jgi:hypothetical protein
MLFAGQWMELENIILSKISQVQKVKGYRRRGPGTREKVSSRRINLEYNTYVEESNVSKLLV